MQVGTMAAVGLIEFYQRHLSSYKGYRCAHCAYYGGASCSGFVKQAIQVHGLLPAMPLIKQRFEDCRAAHAALQASEAPDSTQQSPDKDSSPATKHGDGCANVCTMPCL